MNLRFALFCGMMILGTALIAQAPENWFNLDSSTDGTAGVSTEKMYKEILKDRKGQTVNRDA